MLQFNGPVNFPQLAAQRRLQNDRWNELLNLTQQFQFGFLTRFGRYDNGDDHYGYPREGLPFRDQYGTLQNQHGERIGLRRHSSFDRHPRCSHSRSRSLEHRHPPYTPPGPQSLFGSHKSGSIRVPVRIFKPMYQAFCPGAFPGAFPRDGEVSIPVSRAASIENIHAQLVDAAGTNDIEAHVKFVWNDQILLREMRGSEDLWDSLQRGHVEEFRVYKCPGVIRRCED